jgi:hypothetical protein
MTDHTPAITPPRRALRVGLLVPGVLDPKQAALLQAPLRALLDQITATVAGIPAQAHGHADQAPPPPWMRGLVALPNQPSDAERMVAEVAHAAGYDLHLTLPHGRDACADPLIAQAASCLHLDATEADEPDRSRQAASRIIIRHADLLVVLWDGARTGNAGTALRFATRFGPPVLWLDPAAPQTPRWLLEPADLLIPSKTAAGPAAAAALDRYLHRLLSPPHAHAPHVHGWLGWMAGRISRAEPPPGIDALLAAPVPRFRRRAQLFAMLQRGLGSIRHDPRPVQPDVARQLEPGAPRPAKPKPARPPQRPALRLRRLRRTAAGLGQAFRQLRNPGERQISDPPPATPVGYWLAAYRPISRLSEAAGARYRSSYILIFVLAALSLSAAFAALAFPKTIKLPGTGFELAMLMMLGCIVMRNHARHWHAHWVTTRMVAELCRKQAFLAPLGGTLPGFAAERLSAGTADAWTAWFFAALQRAAPLPSDSFTPDRLAELRSALRENPVQDQINYHRDRRRWTGRAARRLAWAAELFFSLTLAMVAIKLGALLWGALPGWGAALLAGFAGLMVLACARVWVGDRVRHSPLLRHCCECGLPREAVVIGAGLGLLVATGLAIGWLRPGAIPWLGFLAGLLPSLAAAFLGIRAYAELELLGRQSRRMAGVMLEAREALDGVVVGAPLASQEIGQIMGDLAERMLEDVEGWSTLFRVKVVETP